jgi:ankyrin repeat protein
MVSGVRGLTFASGNVHVINAALARSDSMFDRRFGTMSLVMAAIAAFHDDLTLALMCRGYDFDGFTEGGVSPLFLASSQGERWLDVVEFLCKNLPPGAADLPAGMRRKGAVHWACESGNLPVVKAVLGRPEVDVNRVDEKGHSGPYCALHSMRDLEFVELMRVFIDRGLDLNGDAVTIVADLVRTWGPKYSVLELLFQNGLDPLAEVPGTGQQVWQFFKVHDDPQLERLYQIYCAEAVATK